MNNKGQIANAFNSFAAITLTLVVAIVIGVFGAIFLGKMKTSASVTANSYEYNITNTGLEGIKELFSWTNLLILAGVFGIILVVIGGFAYLFAGRQQ